MSVFADIGARALRETRRRLYMCSICHGAQSPDDMEPGKTWCRRCQRVISSPRTSPALKGTPSDCPISKRRRRKPKAKAPRSCDYCSQRIEHRNNVRFCNNKCKHAFGLAARQAAERSPIESIGKFPTEGK